MRNLPLVLVVLVVLGALAVGSPSAGAGASHLPIVERAVAHHGGELYERTETTMTIASANGSFGLRVRRDGGLFEIEVDGTTPEGVGRRAILTNDTVREWRDGHELPLDGEEAARATRFVQARVWFPFLPYGLLGDAVRHEDQGLERWGDRELRRVKVTFTPTPGEKPPDEYAFWLDPESGEVAQYAYAYDMGTPAGGLRFRKAHDHRRVGGILFFDVTNLGVDEWPEAAVDRVDPAFAAALATVSEVELSDIRVRELSAAAE